MPLLESAASEESACISTAPVFTDANAPAASGSTKTILARKSSRGRTDSDPSSAKDEVVFPTGTWWSAFAHGTSPTLSEGASGGWTTLAWLVWLGALFCSALIEDMFGAFEYHQQQPLQTRFPRAQTVAPSRAPCS